MGASANRGTQAEACRQVGFTGETPTPKIGGKPETTAALKRPTVGNSFPGGKFPVPKAKSWGSQGNTSSSVAAVGTT